MNVKITDILKKYTMVIALIVVMLFFQYKTGGSILLPQNINNLISQNAYVFVLSAGMLLCILTGGNIDLACGSVVCFVGGIGAVMMDANINEWVAVVVMIIGGPMGLSNEVKAKADTLLSLSKMTFTHEFARLILFEQLFRAANILNGGHYHRD